MNAIRYRWDSTRYRFIVEVIAEQPDGTAAMHLISKHETAADAAAAAQKLRQERDNTNTEMDRALDCALRATNAALARRVQELESALDKAADDVAFLRNRLDVQAEQDAAALRDAQDDAARLRAALEAVEFVSDDMCTYCPWCDANDNDMVIGDDRYKIQHKPDCQRQNALAQTSEVKHG